jgi:hypothetical protein
MKRAVLLLVAACEAAEPGGYPIGPGGGGGVGGGGGGAVDAGVDDGGDGDAGLQLTGKVCLLTDLRAFTDLTRCADAEASGLIVTLGNRTATTTAGGAFTITAPRGAGFTWHVVGSRADQIVRTAMPFGTDNVIPAVDFEVFRDMQVVNNASIGPLQGSVVVRVVRGAVGQPQVQAEMAGQDIVLFDDRDSVLDWNSGTVGTGEAGIVWIPRVEVPATPRLLTATLTPPGAQAVPISFTIEEETITFLTVDLQ